MYTVKIEVMYPKRELVEIKPFEGGQKPLSALTRDVEQYINSQLENYTERFPLATEFRWEYTELQQGHYLMKLGGGWMWV